MSGGFRKHSWTSYSMPGSSDCSSPRTYGGVEAEPVIFMQVLEEVARHDASTAWCLGQNGVCAMASAFLAPGPARAVWGEGRGVLAWGIEVPPPKATAVPGGYRVSGSWSFASGGHHATWLGGHCIVTETDGTPRKDRNGNGDPAHLALPGVRGHLDRHLGRDRPEGHRKRHVLGDRSLRARGIYPRPRRSWRATPRWTALSLSHRPDVLEWLCLRGPRHRPRDARCLCFAGE